jgi:hypothetical protein
MEQHRAVADNLDLGRPDSVELIFTGKNERRGRPRKEPVTFKTRWSPVTPR